MELIIFYYRAAYSHNFDVAHVLLQAGADPNAETEMKWTPLHSACKWNNASVAGLLLQYGANVNAQSNGGKILFILYTFINKKQTC